MSLSVAEKYVAKKRKDILEYAKVLESIISIDENKMWKTKKEFSTYVNDIVQIYADKYYFLNNSHRDNPIDYSNDNINLILESVIEYCKVNNKMSMLNTWKNETFLLSVIICTSCYVDFATNGVDGDLEDTKRKFKYLLEYFKKTKVLRISNNKYLVNDLFESIKKNVLEDKKIFTSIEGSNYANEYIKLKDNTYKVVFHYNLGLDVYNPNLVKQVLDKYKTKFLSISYDLLEFKILEDLISNRDMFVYVIDTSDITKSMVSRFDNKYLKDYIKIESNDKEIIEEFKNIGITLYEESKEEVK